MVVAFAVTVALVCILRPAAFKVGLVDSPGGRKAHSGDVPIIGGAAMFIGSIAGFTIFGEPTHETLGLVFASLLLVGVGLFDDRDHIAANLRLLIQVAAVLIMTFGANLSLDSIGNPFGFGEILLGPFTILGTLLVAITVINAYNLVDGVDGLAGMLASVALISVAIVGGVNALSTAVALTVVAAVFGFLIFNFPVSLNRHVRTFMGDAGSTFLGFTIVWVTLGISQGEQAIISPVPALWFASIPVYDSLTCFVRRALKGKSPFAPGRDHFHHTLQRGGFGVRQRLAILAGLQALYAAIALTGHFLGLPDVVLFTAWSVLGLTQYKVIETIALRYRSRLIEAHREGTITERQLAARHKYR